MARLALAALVGALATVGASFLRAGDGPSMPMGPATWVSSVGQAGPKYRSMPACKKVFPVPGHRAMAVRVDKEVRCFWMVICGEEYSFRIYDRRARHVRPDGTCDAGDVVGEFRVDYDPAPVEPAQGTSNNVHFPFPLVLSVWSKTSGPERLEVAFPSPQQRVMFLEQLTPERLLIALQPAMRQLMPACAAVEKLARVSFDTGREFVRQWLLQAFRGLATQSPPRQFCAPTGATYPDGQPKVMCDNGWEAPVDLRTILHYTYWRTEPTSLDRDLRACAQALQVPQYVRGLSGLQTRDLLDFEGTGLDFFGPFMSGNFRHAERTARRFVPVESSGYTWDLMMILSVFEAMAVKDCHSAGDKNVFSFSIADPRVRRALEEAAKRPHTTAVVFPFPLDVMGGNVRTGAECPPAVVYLGQPGFDGPGGPAQPIVANGAGGLTSAGAANPYAAAMGATASGGLRFRQRYVSPEDKRRKEGDAAARSGPTDKGEEEDTEEDTEEEEDGSSGTVTSTTGVDEEDGASTTTTNSKGSSEEEEESDTEEEEETSVGSDGQKEEDKAGPVGSDGQKEEQRSVGSDGQKEDDDKEGGDVSTTTTNSKGSSEEEEEEEEESSVGSDGQDEDEEEEASGSGTHETASTAGVTTRRSQARPAQRKASIAQALEAAGAPPSLLQRAAETPGSSGPAILPSDRVTNSGQGASGAYGSSPDAGTAALPRQVGYGAYGHGYPAAGGAAPGASFRATAAVGSPGQPGMTLTMPTTNTPIRVDSNGYATVPPLACANVVKILPGKRSVCAMRSEGAQPGGTEHGDAMTAPRGEFRFAPFSMFAVLDNRYAGVAPGPEAVPGAGPLAVYLLAEIAQPPPNVLNVLRMSDSGEPSLWYYPQPNMAPRLA